MANESFAPAQLASARLNPRCLPGRTEAIPFANAHDIPRRSLEAFAADGRSAVVWSGRDTASYAKNKISWFVATFDPPDFPVQAIKLTLDSAGVRGWNKIDAVQLVGDP